ncbi:hypothetical protein BCF50_2663 [Chryseobacterium daecheongense]|uniref:Uncharacterized protein n=1 Tax=Chryseobacterium daecheongense TaxID=192389 RepID=A0ABY2FSU9_9FLAO|nr:hypothetical protein BCF50_2663 [Chryseobacterium daecheongense]
MFSNQELILKLIFLTSLEKILFSAKMKKSAERTADLKCIMVKYYLLIAATPGSSKPSRLSNIAPPPVET